MARQAASLCCVSRFYYVSIYTRAASAALDDRWRCPRIVEGGGFNASSVAVCFRINVAQCRAIDSHMYYCQHHNQQRTATAASRRPTPKWFMISTRGSIAFRRDFGLVPHRNRSPPGGEQQKWLWGQNGAAGVNRGNLRPTKFALWELLVRSFAWFLVPV